MNDDVTASVRAHVGEDWSIFEWLNGLTEAERRTVLRSHRDAPFTHQADIQIRERVDDALSQLMLLELGLEIGMTQESANLRAIPGLSGLLASSAFVRYLDAYLALSVRFVAKRLEVPYVRSARLNELPVAWPFPPPLPVPARNDADPSMLEFLNLESALEADAEANEAMKFLDDCIRPGPRRAGEALAEREEEPWNEPLQYGLWLRHLSSVADEQRFIRITRGLLKFARAKTEFYLAVERRRENKIPVSRTTWTARHPLTARFGLYDLYFLARLLRAEVSPSAAVTYADGSWLKMLRARAPEVIQVRSNDLADCELVLHAVLDYTCDLVQNSVEISAERLAADAVSRRNTSSSPAVGWRAMYDEELEEIERQRGERRYDLRSASAPAHREAAAPRDAATRPLPPAIPAAGEVGLGDETKGPLKSIWSRRIRTGEHVDDLVGLAFSGGGIRSATFNLGVLQRLQELDLLRQVDYLSTVSGGGYIGAWLLANVRRTRYWLTQPTDWNLSIAHLRRYSNYLSPRSGLMSADTWTMWMSWIRNAVLMQVSGLMWLALLMLVVGIGRLLFNLPSPGQAYSGDVYNGTVAAVLAVLVVLTVSTLWNIGDESKSLSERRVLWGAVLPAWAWAFMTSAILWADREKALPTYSAVLTSQYRPWLVPLALVFVGTWTLSLRSADGRPWWRVALGVIAAVFSTGVMYLAVCAVFWQYGRWNESDTQYEWFAYVFGPSFVLLALTLGVVVMIGMLGRASPDWRREWWTRFGSWTGIYGAGFLAISAATVLGPLLTLYALDGSWGAKVKWGTVLGWIGTVVGGLFAGNGTQPETNGARTWKAQAIRVFARIASLVFIVGAVCLVATFVHVVLVKISPQGAGIEAAAYWMNANAIDRNTYLATAAGVLAIGVFCSWRFELNVFGLNQFYRNRLVRCYLGATRWIPGLRRQHKFTGFDAADDLQLSDLRHVDTDDPPYRGPFPLVNCSLNLGGSSDLTLHTRHSASFVMTPLRCGAERPSMGFAPTRTDRGDFAGGVSLGQAISVSGAAASPNMGYDTSPIVAFLLTMFNVRLAWWFPNPGRRLWLASWLPFSLVYLVRETFGVANENSYFVNVSDGGHFENLGIYELVRRRCHVIIAADAECDEQLAFGSLGRAVRMCETDFGAHIDIDVQSIRRSKDGQTSRAHCAVGLITYANGSRGYLIYLKASITGDEDVDVEQYRAAHPTFPHETTADQFFAEDQFESYRKLGHHIAEMAFRGVAGEPAITGMASKLKNIWTPSSDANSGFVRETEELVSLWDRMRAEPALLPLFRELHGLEITPTAHEPTEQELCVCLELIQLMENAYLELRLDDFWRHPDNQGWVVLLTMWAQSPTFREAWRQYRDVFGIRFGYFCRQRLGL